jgi:alkyldihydroxyacetonephosphate synthase
MPLSKIPVGVINEEFSNDLKKTNIASSDDPQDRLFRAHGIFSSLFFRIKILEIYSLLGHTMDELFILRYGQFERIPDVVVWPSIDF